MFGLRKLDRHAELFDRMSKAVGANFAAAIEDGRYGPEAYRSAVLRCAGCTEAGACEGWHRLHPDGAEHPPGYCRNSALLDALKP